MSDQAKHISLILMGSHTKYEIPQNSTKYNNEENTDMPSVQKFAHPSIFIQTHPYCAP